jgi:hypothetical protein
MRLTQRQKNLVESTNQWLQSNYPETGLIGVAWCFLDCGCLKAVGFSPEAGMVTPFIRLDRQLVKDGIMVACPNCVSDNAVMIHKVCCFGTAWFRPIPTQETRVRVKKELFLPLLERDSLEMHEGGECQTVH